MIAFVPALLAKVTLVFAAGLIVTSLMRGISPALRHLVLLASLICGLTLPALMAISPRWDVGLLASASSQLSPTVASSLGTDPRPVTRADRPSLISPPPVSPRRTTISEVDFSRTPISLNPAAAIALVWIIGVMAVLGWLAIGRWRLHRIARDAWPLTKPDWQRVLDAACAEAGVTREVQLLSSPVVSTPLTWGTRVPVILLPEDALDWTEEHRRVVLRHEIAHVARGDSLVQLAAGFVCSIYWFHPLVWSTERRLRAECERACDDRVVSLGTPATDYAAHLLQVARAARSFGAPGFLSVAMARPSQLEGRLLSVLNESRDRVAASRGARWMAATISALVMLPLAAFRAVPRSAPSERLETGAIASAARTAHGQPRNEKVNNAQQQPAPIVAYDAANELDSTFTLSAPVRSGGTLDIDLKTGGGITIESWDKPQVLVNARLAGRNWRDTRVTLEPSSTGATLSSDFIVSSRNQSTSHDFDIRLPREFNVRIKSSGGKINITNMSGEFSGYTGGGQINLENLRGQVDLSTGGGQIHVVDSNVDGSVSTGGGQVHIVGVTGNLRGASGSGPVIRAGSNSDLEGSGYGSGYGKGASGTASSSAGGTAYASAGNGPIIMNSTGGAISLPSAPNGAHVTTGGGNITIGSAGGAVFAQTGGGDVEIGPTAGSVDATTGAGNVEIDFRGKGSVDVNSGNGRVTITAPSDLNANLELITAYTRNFRGKTQIISDWPVRVTETQEWDETKGTPRRYVIVRQQIGNGGPLIRVNTVNGDIVLRKRS